MLGERPSMRRRLPCARSRSDDREERSPAPILEGNGHGRVDVASVLDHEHGRLEDDPARPVDLGETFLSR
jgi:hypothetical protein